MIGLPEAGAIVAVGAVPPVVPEVVAPVVEAVVEPVVPVSPLVVGEPVVPLPVVAPVVVVRLFFAPHAKHVRPIATHANLLIAAA